MGGRRVFKTRYFGRWMHKTDLTEKALCKAIAEMADGLIDADLGGGVLKKRISLPGRGKSGGTRVLIATNKRDLWFLIFGFEKNQRDNISGKELQALQAYAADLLKLSSADLDNHVRNEALQEICDGKNESIQPNP
jgi:hypothetical protein